MDERLTLLIIAFALVILFIVMPYIIRMRIAILRWLRWKWLADFHERHMKGIVLAVRVILVVIAIVLIVHAFGG
jgi:hypothetical protein